MRKFLLAFSTLLFSAVSMPLCAQAQGTVVFDFMDRDSFNLCEEYSAQYSAHNGYRMWSYNAEYVGWSYTTPAYLSLYSSSVTDGYYDDCLISPELELKKGELYEVVTAPACSTYGYTTDVYVNFGQGEKTAVADFKQIGAFKDVPYVYYGDGGTIAPRSSIFTVDADGKYRVAIRVVGRKANLFNTRVLSHGATTIPEAVADFSVVPAFNGNSTVALSFTMPSFTLTGQPLSGSMTYNIYRNGEIVATASAAPGEKVSVSDSGMAKGYLTYSLEIISGEHTSDKIDVQTYVGTETPTAVTDLKLGGKGGEFMLTWNAPVYGTHGVALDRSKLKYKVDRVVKGVRQTLADSQTETSFADDFASEEITDLYYEITAIYGFENSVPAKSNTVKVGWINLPFADSFAGAVLNPLKWEAAIINGSHNWEAADHFDADKPTESPVIYPYDGDGGMAYYNFYSAMNNHSARLMTMPLSKASSSAPVIDFYLYRYGGRKEDYIKLQVMADSGDWQDVDGAAFYNIAKEDDPAYGLGSGWYHYAISLADVVPADCQTYRVAFTSISDYGSNMAIDAVRIYNAVNKDLEVTSLSAPEKALAGKDLLLTLSVSNNGNDVKASDYSIEIEHDFPGTVVVEPVDIPSLSVHDFVIAVPVTAEEAFDLADYTFKATVVFDGDEVNDNNSSIPVSVPTGFVEYDAPQNATAAVDDNDDDAIRLSWTHAATSGYQELVIYEDFNSLEDGATGDFNGWKSYDFDQAAGDFRYNVGASEFTVVNGGSPMGGNGNYIGVSTKAGNQQDDWIISPRIDAKPTSTLDFDWRIAVYSADSDIKVEVMYSEEDYDPENPAASFVNLKTYQSGSSGPNVIPKTSSFTSRTDTGIPGTAKYIALHFITKASGFQVMWLDDLKITETDHNPLLGYHVYERYRGRLTDDKLAADVNTYSFVDKARAADDEFRYFYVTAVYGEGESTPTELSNGITTSIESALAGAASIAPVEGGVLVKGHDGEIAEVYNLDGRKAAAMRCSGISVISLQPGVYVVKAGADTAKVVVK